MILFLAGFGCGYLISMIAFGIFVYSRKHQYDGTIKILPTPEGKIFSLELNRSPETLEDKKVIHFQVEAPEDRFADKTRI